MRVVLDLKPEEVDALSVLGIHLQPLDKGAFELALLRLVYHAVQGLERASSWERAWVVQAFGEDWIMPELLEQDPQQPWRQIPRPPRPRRSKSR